MSRHGTRAIVVLCTVGLSSVLASCGFLSVGNDQVQQARTACKQAVIPLAGGPSAALPRSLELTKVGDGWTGKGTLSVASTSRTTTAVRSYSCSVTTVNGTLVAKITDLSR